MGIGEQNLGEFAREQLEKARRDPRLERGRGAMVADYWSALEEAERTRTLGVLGLHELQRVLERQKEDADEVTDEHALRSRQALWERAELARAEIENGHPALNAQALISMNSALDALVEEFVPSMRDIRFRMLTEGALKRVEAQVPEASEQVTQEMRDKLLEALRGAIELPKIQRLTGSGTERYERVLKQAGLGAPEGRPIPEDLDQALTELGALRDVLVHRAGRVDTKALKQAPSLRYEDGELVRISGDEYRTYSAALRCYGQEIVFRPMLGWPGVSEKNKPDLQGWRGYYVIGV